MDKFKAYGVPYKGSKNEIAEDIVNVLPRAKYLVDLFAGGCAITHCAMLTDKYEKFIVNDLNDTPQLFLSASKGELKGYSTIPTREEFFKEKDDDCVIRQISSFGNDGITFAYGKEIENIKIHAEKMISMNSIWERKKEYRKFVKALSFVITEQGIEKVNIDIQRLQSLERLERLERLENLSEKVDKLEIYQVDYMDVYIPDDSVIYCDIPYANTNSGQYQGFDHQRFYKWLSIINHPVFVSEYTAPPETSEIFTIKKRVQSDTSNQKTADEKVFIQTKYLNWYESKMKEQRKEISIFDLLEEDEK